MCKRCLENTKRDASLELVAAKIDYVGVGDEELSFEKARRSDHASDLTTTTSSSMQGDRIVVRERDGSGWALGHLEGEREDDGWFPLARCQCVRTSSVAAIGIPGKV